MLAFVLVSAALLWRALPFCVQFCAAVAAIFEGSDQLDLRCGWVAGGVVNSVVGGVMESVL